jgi:hypothetical protein
MDKRGAVSVHVRRRKLFLVAKHHALIGHGEGVVMDVAHRHARALLLHGEFRPLARIAGLSFEVQVFSGPHGEEHPAPATTIGGDREGAGFDVHGRAFMGNFARHGLAV